MLIADAESRFSVQAHLLELHQRAFTEEASGRPGFSKPIISRDVGEVGMSAARKETELVQPQKLRSCFTSSRPSLATFDLEWFLNLSLAARDLNDIYSILHLLVEGLRAKAAALVHVGPTRHSNIFELFVNVPSSLVETVKSRRIVDDPFMVACELRVLGFPSSGLDRIIEMTNERREALEIYASYGLNEMYAVPFSVPNEPRGFCNFGFSDPETLTTDVMGIITMAGPVLFESARRVQGLWIERRKRIELTPRQLDCLSGAARGQNDAEIAWDLGISVQTVHDHFEAARKRYGARKRTDLMIRAIRSGDLHWDRITSRDGSI